MNNTDLMERLREELSRSDGPYLTLEQWLEAKDSLINEALSTVESLTAERNALRRALRNSQAKMLSSELKRVAEITALREALREVRITAAVHDNWQLAAPRIFAIVESVLKENCDE